jgi:hypothetical protein
VSPPVCAICAKAKKLYKHKRGNLCANCAAKLPVVTEWYPQHRVNILTFLGRVP